MNVIPEFLLICKSHAIQKCRKIIRSARWLLVRWHLQKPRRVACEFRKEQILSARDFQICTAPPPAINNDHSLTLFIAKTLAFA